MVFSVILKYTIVYKWLYSIKFIANFDKLVTKTHVAYNISFKRNWRSRFDNNGSSGMYTTLTDQTD